MITPQQRNAWRGAYLRQLRKIASTDILLDGWEEDFEFNNALEAHLVHFTLNDLMIIQRYLSYVFSNHIIYTDINDLDPTFLKEYSGLSLSLGGLYDHLLALSNYTRCLVLDNVVCNEETRQNMMSSLIRNDKQGFIEVAQSCANIGEICTICGYFSAMILPSFSTDFLEDAKNKDEQGIDDYIKEKAQTTAADADVVGWLLESQDTLDLVRKYSMFDLAYLEDIPQHYYCLLVKLWATFSILFNTAFDNKEISILNDIIIHSQSSELLSDLERLAYLLFGVAPEKLFAPNSFDLQELSQLKSKMNSKDSLSIPWLNDVEE